MLIGPLVWLGLFGKMDNPVHAHTWWGYIADKCSCVTSSTGADAVETDATKMMASSSLGSFKTNSNASL